MRRTVFRGCTLCEASCGLEFVVEGDRIVSVRPDDDVLSHGFACPKGIASADIHHDPDRLRQPMIRQADGSFRPASPLELTLRHADPGRPGRPNGSASAHHCALRVLCV